MNDLEEVSAFLAERATSLLAARWFLARVGFDAEHRGYELTAPRVPFTDEDGVPVEVALLWGSGPDTIVAEFIGTKPNFRVLRERTNTLPNGGGHAWQEVSEEGFLVALTSLHLPRKDKPGGRVAPAGEVSMRVIRGEGGN